MSDSGNDTTVVIVGSISTGIGTTFLINAFIAAALFLLFLCCCQHTPMFDLSRKLHLQKRHHEIMNYKQPESDSDTEQEEEEEEEEAGDDKEMDKTESQEKGDKEGQKKSCAVDEKESNVSRKSLLQCLQEDHFVVGMTEEEDQIEEPPPRKYVHTKSRLLKRNVLFLSKNKFVRLLLFLWHVVSTLLVPTWRHRDSLEVAKEYGRDLAAYIYFQQMLIYAMALCTVIGCVVLFPLHLTGEVPSIDAFNANRTRTGGINFWRRLIGFEAQYPAILLDTIETTSLNSIQLDSSSNVVDSFGSFILTKDDSFVMHTSIIMVAQNPWKLYMHIFLVVIFLLTIGGFLLRFSLSNVVKQFNFAGTDLNNSLLNQLRFLRKRKGTAHEYRKQLATKLREWMELNAGDSEAFLISPFSIKVSGLPSYFTSNKAFERMVLTFVAGSNRDTLDQGSTSAGEPDIANDPKHKVVKTVLVHDVSTRIELQDKLNELMNELDHYMFIYQERLVKAKGDISKAKRPILRIRCGSKENQNCRLLRVDAISYYEHKIDLHRAKVNRWDREYRRILDLDKAPKRKKTKRKGKRSKVTAKVDAEDQADDDLKCEIRCAGWGYIVFRSQHHLDEFYKKYEKRGLSISLFNRKNDALPSGDQHEQTRTDIVFTIPEEAIADVPTTAPPKLELQKHSIEMDSMMPISETEHISVDINEPRMSIDSTGSEDSTSSIVDLISTGRMVSRGSSLVRRIPSIGENLYELEQRVIEETKKAVSNMIMINIATGRKIRRTLTESAHSTMEHIRSHVCAIRRTRSEPQDLNWEELYSWHKRGRWEPKIRTMFLHLILILIFIFFGTPATIVSGVQALLGFIIPAEWLDLGHSTLLPEFFRAIIFQWLPTLTVFIASIATTSVISLLLNLDRFHTHGKKRRTFLLRIYCFFVITSILLPSLWLISLDGIIDYLYNSNQLLDVFKSLFLPASGAFFIGLILQRAMLKGAADLIRLYDFLIYLWRIKGRLWGRRVTPKEELRAAALSDFSLDREYSALLGTTCIVLCYSVFSPLILLAGMFYLLVKHTVDRFCIMFVYGQRAALAKSNAELEKMKLLQSSTVKTKTSDIPPGTGQFIATTSKIKAPFTSDFNSHTRRMRLVVTLAMINLAIMCCFMIIFYGIRITFNLHFIAHTVIMCFVLLVVIVATYLFSHLNDIRQRRMRRMFNELDVEKADIALRLAWEPPHPFIKAAAAAIIKELPASISNKERRELQEKLQETINRSTLSKWGCWMYNNCLPMRAIIEQVIERCCVEFVDAFIT